MMAMLVGFGPPPSNDERERLAGWAAWQYSSVGKLDAAHAYKAAPPTFEGARNENWLQVATQLTFEGVHGSKHFPDKTGRRWYHSGPTISIDTSEGPFGTSGFFGGSGDLLKTDSTADLDFGVADFTIEGFASPDTVSGNANLLTKVNAGNGAWAVYRQGNLLKFYASSNGTSWNIANGITIGTVAVDTWFYYKITRVGSLFSTSLDAVAGASATSTAAIRSNTAPVILARDNTSGTEYWTGHIGPHRITKGTGLPGIDVPTEPFPEG
jgi:hypothetical protein